MNGLDVCSQQNTLDWQKVKVAGIEFIIPRTGRGITLDDNGMDYRFLEYVQGAQAAGINIPGVYHFIYVHSMEDALRNAKKAVEIVEKAGLPKSTVIWCDQEEPTVIDAVKHGFNLTTDLQRKVTEIFCNYCLAQGYCTGVYLNHDYLYRVYGPDIVNEYDIWYEDHTNAHPEQPCLIRQTDWHGRVAGISTDVDKDDWIGTYTASTAKPQKDENIAENGTKNADSAADSNSKETLSGNSNDSGEVSGSNSQQVGEKNKPRGVDWDSELSKLLERETDAGLGISSDDSSDSDNAGNTDGTGKTDNADDTENADGTDNDSTDNDGDRNE